MTKQHGDIDGWHVELHPVNDVMFPWKAEAFDSLWEQCVTSEGFDPENCLSALAYKTGLDRKALLKVFGL